ncbi:MAG: hypothetical protein ACXW30_06350 [Micavibrio sp.]
MRQAFNRLLSYVTPRHRASGLPALCDADSRVTAALKRVSTAYYGDRCRTVSFLDASGNTEWHGGQQDPESKTWTITKCSELQNISGSAAAIGEAVTKVKTLSRGLSFFEAVAELSLYERGQIALHYVPACNVESLPDHAHYVRFAEREGIIFDVDGVPHPTLNGEVVTDGAFAKTAIERAITFRRSNNEIQQKTAKALFDAQESVSQVAHYQEYHALPDFLQAIQKFTHDRFRYSSWEPCILSQERAAEDNFRFRLLTSDILDKTGIGKNAGHTQLEPVKKFLSAVPDEVRDSFEDVFTAVRTAESRAIKQNNCRSPGEFRDDEAAKLQAALDTIWVALPELNPNILDGFDYVMNDEKLVHEIMPRRAFGDRGFLHTMDFDLDTKLSQIRDGQMTGQDAEKTLAATAQYIKNMQALKPFAPEIARMAVSAYLHCIYQDNARCTHNNPLRFIRHRELATAVLRNPVVWAERIQSGRSHTLLPGPMYNAGKDSSGTTQAEAKAFASGADRFLSFCTDVAAGTWFDRRIDKIAALASTAQQRFPAPRRQPQLAP